VTADDERVCVVCGPLDQVTIPLHRRFTSGDGQKFYAPGVHPNCRCTMELVYPESQFDDVVKSAPREYRRDWHGRFSHTQSLITIGRRKIEVDRGIANTLAHLNQIGLKTKYSCQGSPRLDVWSGAGYIWFEDDVSIEQVQKAMDDLGVKIDHIVDVSNSQGRAVKEEKFLTASGIPYIEAGDRGPAVRFPPKFAKVMETAALARVVKNMPDDPFNRDEDGEFAHVEQRHQEQETRPVLNPIQRYTINPLVTPAPASEARLQPLRHLKPVKRFSLQPLTSQEIQAAQEVQEELDAAVEDDVKHSGWNYSTVAWVSGTTKGVRDQTRVAQWDDLVRQFASDQTQRALIGKSVHFTSSYTGFISRHRTATDDTAFESAYKREAFEAAVNAQKRNANRNIPRGGVADAKRIAPILTDPLDMTLKEALGGLTNEQLVNIIDETLSQSLNDSQTISLVAPDSSHGWTREEIRSYYEKRTPDETATAIMMAYAREKSIIQNEFEPDWQWTMEDVFGTSQQGAQAKAEAWRDGQTPRAGTIAVLYRMGNGWHGSDAGMGIGVINNSYLISNVTTVKPPKHIHAQGGELIEHLVVIDLVPHMDDPYDDSNDFFVQGWSD
jgi:hypothetical protein